MLALSCMPVLACFLINLVARDFVTRVHSKTILKHDDCGPCYPISSHKECKRKIGFKASERPISSSLLTRSGLP